MSVATTPARVSETTTCGMCDAASTTSSTVAACAIDRRSANGVRLSRYIRSVAVTTPRGAPLASMTGRWWMPASSMSIIASTASRSGANVSAGATIRSRTGVS